MRQMVEKIWELLECNIKEMNKKSQDVILNYEAHDRFYDYFKELYAEIKKNYMKNEVKNLDRHKVSGIIIVTIIKSDVIQYKGKMEENYIFFGKYVIATSVAITYMQDRLNEKILDWEGGSKPGKNERLLMQLRQASRSAPPLCHFLWLLSCMAARK